MKTLNIAQYSGGKDSTALLCWMIENKIDFTAIYNDTGFEDAYTYSYISEITKMLRIPLKTLHPKKDFMALALSKKRFPASKSRFCTVSLKIEPFIDFILKQDVYDKIVVYQGIRNEESLSRASMPSIDDYFLHYFTARKNGKKDTYRRKEVLAFCEEREIEVVRPIKTWSFKQCFDLIEKYGLPIHKHYTQGFSRVGCFPCVLSNAQSIRQLIKHYPERIDLIREKEKEFGHTFFPPGVIPERFCTKRVVTKKNEVKFVPCIDDVISYLAKNPNQTLMFDTSGDARCESVYNQC